MPKISRLFCAVLLLVFAGTGLLFSADNRYALVIGNGRYKDSSISALANPVNDATDVAATLKNLGYNVTLKTDAGLRDIMDAVQDFSFNLRRSPENEGLFWFAGHGLSVRGIHYMLPVDVDPVNDNIIARGSYSVDDLMEEIGSARNRTNLIVIDACRNTLLPGGNRSVGSRGLAVLAADDYRVAGNKVVYSTMAGKTASDGVPGSRNSPFAQAFIENIGKPESFDDVFLDIANETMRLTRGDQQPYSMGSFAVKSYTINPLPPVAQAAPGSQAAPQAVQPAAAPVQQPAAPQPSTEPARVAPKQPAAPKPQKAPTDFTLDGKKVFSINASPFFWANMGNPGGFGPGANLTLNFYEKYGPYRETFFVPNSFFFTAQYYYGKSNVNLKNNIEADQTFNVAAFGLGAQWKIRLEESQRFIFNVGLAFQFFLGQATCSNNNENFYYGKGDKEWDVDEKGSMVSPGLKANVGIGFRFNRLVSLNLDLAFTGAFASGEDIKQAVEWPWDPGITHYEGSGNGNAYFGLKPIIVALGLSFWFPR